MPAMEPGPHSSPAPRGLPRLRGVAAPVLLVLLAGAAFCWIGQGVSQGIGLHADTNRDLLLVRGCISSDVCPAKGAPHAFPYLDQGGVWKMHLALLDTLGLGLQSVALVSILGFLLAMGLLFQSGRSLFLRSPVLSVRSLAFLVVLAVPITATMARTGTLLVVWNPVLAPLPAAAALLSCLLAVQTRKTVFYVGAALGFALSAQVHPIANLFVPVAVLLFLIYQPERVALAWFLSGMVFCGSYLAVSRDALVSLVELLANLSALPDREGVGVGPSLPFGAEALMALAWCAAFVFLVRAGRLPRSPASTALALLATVPFVAVAAPALLLHWTYSPHYLVPFQLCLLLMESLVLVGLVEWAGAFLAGRFAALGPPGRLPALLLAGLAGGVLVVSLGPDREAGPGTPDRETALNYEDMEALAGALRDLGVVTYEEAVRRLRGPEMFNVASALELYLPRSGAPGPHAVPGDLVLLLKTGSTGEPPPGWKVINHTDQGRLFAAPFRSSVAWDRIGIACDPDRPDQPDSGDWTGVLVLVPAQGDGHPWLDTLPPILRCRLLRVRVPVTPVADHPLLLYGHRRGVPGDLSLDVVEVRGLKTATALPSARVLLAGGQAGARGEVVFQWRSDTVREYRLPTDLDLVEVPVTGPGVAALLEVKGFE